MCKENKGPDAYATIRLISWQVLKVCHKRHWFGLNSEVKLFLFFPLLIFFHGKKIYIQMQGYLYFNSQLISWLCGFSTHFGISLSLWHLAAHLQYFFGVDTAVGIQFCIWTIIMLIRSSLWAAPAVTVKLFAQKKVKATEFGFKHISTCQAKILRIDT